MRTHLPRSVVVALLLLTSLATGFGQKVIRGPYLQTGTPTSIVVRWRTDIATDSQVVFGTNKLTLDRTAGMDSLTTEHEMTLTNLLPNTEYFYTIGTMANVLANSTNQYFITSPIPGTAQPVRFWVIGDAGTTNYNQVNVRNAFYNINQNRHLDLWLQLGDNAYMSGYDYEYQAAVFDMYSNLLAQSVTWPTIGNHETVQSTLDTTNYPYFAIFTLPTQGEAGGVPSGTEKYYSFNYANIHFVCLDSMISSRSPTGPMATWLKADLQANTNQWLIAYWHHAPYSKGSHDSDIEQQMIEMRTNIVPILEAYGVDLVLSGHSHDYERSMFLNGNYGPSTTLTSSMLLDTGSGRETDTGAYKKPAGAHVANKGAVYAVVGSSGQTTGGTLNHPVMYYSANNLASMLVVVQTNRLDAWYLRETGETNDSFTIIKQSASPDNTNLVLTITGSVSNGFRLTWPSVGGVRYRVYYSNATTNGLSSNPFTALERSATDETDPSPAGTNSTMTFLDDFSLTGVPPYNGRFYRVGVVIQ